MVLFDRISERSLVWLRASNWGPCLIDGRKHPQVLARRLISERSKERDAFDSYRCK